MFKSVIYYAVLLLGLTFGQPCLAQKEIVPIPIQQINRDSLNKVIWKKEKVKDFKSLAVIYGGLFNYFLYSESKDSAMLYAAKAEENSLLAADSTLYYFIQLQLGEFNAGIDSLLAVAYYHKALAYYTRTSHTALQASALGGLAFLYGLSKDTANLIVYLNKAEQVLALSNDTFNLVGANDLRAHIFINRNQLDSAIPLLKQNLRYIEAAKDYGNSESIRIFWKGLQLNLLADCYYRQRNYTQAIELLQQARQFDKVTELFDAQNSIRYRLLTSSFIAINKKDSALKYLDEFFKQTIKAYNIINPDKLRALTEKYEAEKKQRQIEKLQQQNRLHQIAVATQKKLNLAFACILSLTLLSAYFAYKNIQHKRKLQLSEIRQKAELAKKEAVELERLRISSELHDDLGSGLSTIRLISEMMRATAVNHTEEQLGKISESCRDLVQKMNEIVWALNANNDNMQSLLAYIRQYAIKTLDDVGIPCYITIPCNTPDIVIGGNERRNIFLMVKECIHNIIKHSKATAVVIEIGLDETLRILIHDNGIGFSSQQQGHYHFGISNLMHRADVLNGSIQWLKDQGTAVIIQIPVPKALHKSVSL